MALNLICPCPTQTEVLEFSVEAEVDSFGHILGTNTVFDVDALWTAAFNKANRYFKILAEHQVCPGKCLRTMGATFEELPVSARVLDFSIGGRIVAQTIFYKVTVKATIDASCTEHQGPREH